MAWWAGGNGRQPLGPQAREAQRLDRRVTGTQRAGVGPAPSQGLIIGRIAVIFGTAPTAGIFIYNGPPAGPASGAANPPQIALVPSGVTTDPYGNAITSSKILMQGNVITESGGIFRTAATSPLIQLDGPHNAVLAYDASAVLRETIAPVATTDGLGNTVQAGFTVYAPGLFAQLTAAALQWGGTGITVAPVVGSGAAAQVQISSGQTAGNTVESVLSLNTAATGSIANSTLSASLDLTTIGAGLKVAEGSNAKQGTATLVAGTVTVANTSVTASSRIFLTCQVPGGTPGFLRISARTAGVNFTILSSSNTDTSTVAYEMFEPG